MAREFEKRLDRKLLGAERRRDAGGLQDREPDRARAASGSTAASSAADRRLLRLPLRRRRPGTGVGVGARLQPHDGGIDLRRRREGARRHLEQEFRAAPAIARARRAARRPCCPAARRCAPPPRAGTSASGSPRQGGHGSAESQPTRSGVADVVRKVGDDAERPRQQPARHSRTRAHRPPRLSAGRAPPPRSPEARAARAGRARSRSHARRPRAAARASARRDPARPPPRGSRRAVRRRGRCGASD